MSSPRSSPGEARKQNGSRKRKRPSSQDSDINGAAKNKAMCVVRIVQIPGLSRASRVAPR